MSYINSIILINLMMMDLKETIFIESSMRRYSCECCNQNYFVLIHNIVLLFYIIN